MLCFFFSCTQEDTISINHNWMNAFSVDRMWSHLKAELRLVKICIVYEQLWPCKQKCHLQ